MQQVEHDGLEVRWRNLAQKFEQITGSGLAHFIERLTQTVIRTRQGRNRRT